MKNINIAFLISCLIGLCSCENVIDIDLNSSNPALVADAVIEPNKISSLTLSYTSDYFGTEDQVYENNAIVRITDKAGNTELLINNGNGLYIGESLIGQINHDYELSIQLNDTEYIGTSQLLTPTKIVDLEFIDATGPGSNRDEQAYNLVISFTNNPDEENYYLLKYFKNDEPVEHQYTALPAEFIGTTDVVTYDPPFPIYEKGDKVRLEIYSIDEGTYDYYNQLEEITNGRGNGSTPYNPESNLGNDILGYFRAWSMDTKTINITPESN